MCNVSTLKFRKPKLCIWGLHSYHFYGQNVIIRLFHSLITFHNLRPDTLYIEIKNDNDEYFIEFSRVLGVAHKLQLALKYAINTKSTIVQVILHKSTHYSWVST